MTHSGQLSLFRPRATPIASEKNGAVYTRRWTVDLILDLAGYTADRDLAAMLAVEPSAGDGNFLVAMAERLMVSCRHYGRAWSDCSNALIAYELNEASASNATAAVIAALVAQRVPREQATALAKQWIRVGDYLVDAPRLPAAHFVIGNPPYIRLEDVSDEMTAFYRNAFATMRGRADIYVGFFEAALRQLAPNGVCAFICADRWMSNQYGAALRGFITHGFAVDVVIEMHHAKPFEDDVAAYPAVTVIRRASQQSAVIASMNSTAEQQQPDVIARAITTLRDHHKVEPVAGLRAARVASWFEGDTPWPCSSPERIALLKRLEAEFHPLEDPRTQTRVGIGVATGCDRVFITTDPELVESSRLLPLAMVGDTLGGTVEWSKHYLVNPWDAEGLVDLAKFPRLQRYLRAQEAILRKRHVAQRRPETWYRTIDRVTPSLTSKKKLYLPDMRDVIHPVLDQGETYPHHNLYFVTSEVWDLEVLGGLLLSSVGQFFVEMYGVRMRGGWLRFQAQYLRRIRVPRPDEITTRQADALRKSFRARDSELATAIACAVYRIDGGLLESRSE
jgi:hypothetical protein